MYGVQYEGLSGRLWVWYSCQFMSDTFLTDLSIHIHDKTLGQDILRCSNLGSLTEKRPGKVGYMLFVAGNSSVTPCVCIVYRVCSLCTFFSLVSVMFSFLSYMTHHWKVVLMAQYSHSKPLTLGAAHAARLCCEGAWLDDVPTLCSRCTCLYSVDLHAVPTTGWTDLYERSRLHPPFTSLVWRFVHQCVLDGLSIEPGLATVASVWYRCLAGWRPDTV